MNVFKDHVWATDTVMSTKPQITVSILPFIFIVEDFKRRSFQLYFLILDLFYLVVWKDAFIASGEKNNFLHRA